ncbi:Huntingtin interacting protein E-like protein [Arcticibacter svalbardensis MN12-7]|uniref:Huntingtin interacting protein E-like protein n=1 Tax=Arcticibacter svalbardensis MN12-7 TaxID=1150600 RepID=R9GV75_9SPHI|nr:Fic family protein [Arcticibacter svalbardensis]EOR95616.1 Huntingtin interacting protein E-like protein [Arcticibacter svalbardensis MN12-7]
MARIDDDILNFIEDHPSSSSGEIHKAVGKTSFATTKRAIAVLVATGQLIAEGQTRATRYILSPASRLFSIIDMAIYFEKEIDERKIKEGFNFQLITNVLRDVHLFTADEGNYLQQLQEEFRNNVSHMTAAAYNKEMERLAIDLSWKSSQIEGNTYSLLETERLLKDKETAAGKPKDDATMLLNHKEALNFIIETPDYVVPLTIARIEDIHSILIKDLEVERNIRQRRVGILGTNYKPLDNEHQIREALEYMCRLINRKNNIFEKSLLALILLSYIQAFNDGNQRTARIISNAILIANQYCPISFRTIDAVEYKKAMLIFYEQNNVSVIKKIFIEQFRFAVKTYF